MTTTTTETVPYEHGDPRIGSLVDTDTWRAVPAPKVDDGDPLDRLGGYCVIAGDMPDEPDVWIEVTAEYPQAVAEFIVEAVRNEHGRQANPRIPQTSSAVAIRQATRIVGTDEDGIAQLVKAGKLTEMYTRPTSGTPEAIYNVTELEALAAIERVRALHAKRDVFEVDEHGVLGRWLSSGCEACSDPDLIADLEDGALTEDLAPWPCDTIRVLDRVEVTV